MTEFSIVAVLLTAIALLFVLPPLLRKDLVDQTQMRHAELNLAVLRDQMRELDADLSVGAIESPAHESARHELERRVAEEVRPPVSTAAGGTGRRWPAVAVGLAVPLLAVSLYAYWGMPAALDPARLAAITDNAAITPEQIDNMIEKLAQRLKNSPEDAKGWSMLARAYSVRERFADAAGAYARLVALVPVNADLLTDYADALAMSQNTSLQGEPEKLIDRALAADPNNIKALALWGSAAFERRDFSGAVARWQKILALVPADSDIARSVSGSIGEAQSLAGAASTGVESAARRARSGADGSQRHAASGGA